nr:hypothetical protein [Tanacetum cinerariifolium]
GKNEAIAEKGLPDALDRDRVPNIISRLNDGNYALAVCYRCSEGAPGLGAEIENIRSGM